MKFNDIKAAIEAILFSLGVSVELKKLAEIIEMDQDTTKKILHDMMDDYYKPGRGIHLIELEGSYQLCTKREHYEYIKRATNKTIKYELTEVQIETLSIIAYKQPITKLHIEQIRGVKSDHAVNKLVEYSLIEEKGRMSTPGRPILFGTTEDFLRNFGFTSTEELPNIDEEKVKVIRKELEEEFQLSFDQSNDELQEELVISRNEKNLTESEEDAENEVVVSEIDKKREGELI